jgi:hypothetical protein
MQKLDKIQLDFFLLVVSILPSSPPSGAFISSGTFMEQLGKLYLFFSK